MWPHSKNVATIMDVSVRELKNRLSEYLRRANAGEEVIITSRGKVIARLLGPGNAQQASPKEVARMRLRNQPWIRASRGKTPLPHPIARAKSGEKSLSDWVSEQRE